MSNIRPEVKKMIRSKKRKYVMVDRIDWGQALFGIFISIYGLACIIYSFWLSSIKSEDFITNLMLLFAGILVFALGGVLAIDSKSKEKEYVQEEKDC